jgi:carbon monoxide dehydrogenase subunit G
VNKPIDVTWSVLNDIERIAPCMPGAELQDITDEVFLGVVKVKLGVIGAAFKGQAVFIERDDENHKVILSGSGRDTGGKGSADALITAKAYAMEDNRTRVTVDTELRISGKIAQFGRGIMADVSKQLMGQFADNLNTMLDEQFQGIGSVDRQVEVSPINLRKVAGKALAKRIMPPLVGVICVGAIIWFAVR